MFLQASFPIFPLLGLLILFLSACSSSPCLFATLFNVDLDDTMETTCGFYSIVRDGPPIITSCGDSGTTGTVRPESMFRKEMVPLFLDDLIHSQSPPLLSQNLSAVIWVSQRKLKQVSKKFHMWNTFEIFYSYNMWHDSFSVLLFGQTNSCITPHISTISAELCIQYQSVNPSMII